MSDGEERTASQTAARIVRGLAYTTSKFTRIADWRLAVFFYFCQLAVLIGIVSSLIIGKTFLALEVPIGVISSYAYAPTAYAEHQAATSAGTITAPCGNLVRSPRGTPRAIPDHASPTNRLVVYVDYITTALFYITTGSSRLASLSRSENKKNHSRKATFRVD